MNTLICSCVVFVITIQIISALPTNRPKVPGLDYQRNPDGSVSGSFGFSHALNGPGTNGAFGASQTFSVGPNGASFGGSHSAALNAESPFGNNFGFSQSNSLSNNIGPSGFSSSGANAASSQQSNPLFSSSQANANAFANQVNYNNNFRPFQQKQPFFMQQFPLSGFNRF
ncbi:unnamed protein product [Allacma fusca]|uniref:Uncharacterized protein n=1 Tax=Allacma fusca TaxID=39272 RepID=A0A8J2J4Y2_9HEXA|nr:unnamed protein product [Allacma fusca]